MWYSVSLVVVDCLGCVEYSFSYPSLYDDPIVYAFPL